MKTAMLIEVSPQELQELISKALDEKLKAFSPSPQKREEILTVEETIKLLSIDRSTLNRWNAKGILKTRKIGNAARYYLSDIQKILEGREDE